MKVNSVLSSAFLEKSSVFKNQEKVTNPKSPIANVVASLNLSQDYRKYSESRKRFAAVNMELAKRPSELDKEAQENTPPYGSVCWIAVPNSKIMHVLPEGSDPDGYTWTQDEYHPAVELLCKSNDLPLVFGTAPKEWAEAYAPETLTANNAMEDSDVLKINSTMLEALLQIDDTSNYVLDNLLKENLK